MCALGAARDWGGDSLSSVLTRPMSAEGCGRARAAVALRSGRRGRAGAVSGGSSGGGGVSGSSCTGGSGKMVLIKEL